MCGILGLADLTGGTCELRQFARALTRIRHRGPDDEGILAFDHRDAAHLDIAGRDTDPSLGLPQVEAVLRGAWPVLLGHRRLAILDLSSAGHQPMQVGQRYWITYNGEIYNFLELRRELSAHHEFRSTSDTEVLLVAYATWGEGMLSRLLGMFSLCILDVHKSELFLARDPFGIKPLYFTTAGGKFGFASEIKGLEELRLVRPECNLDLLYEYLRYGERSCDDRTMFANVYALTAGHFLRVDLRAGCVASPIRYFQLSAQTSRGISFEAAVSEVSLELERSIDLHMRSDVPVGSCLSGGLDSTAIVCLAQRRLHGAAKLQTFSFVTAEDKVINEEPYIDMVSGVDKHLTRPDADDLRLDLEELISAHDLPFASSSIYAQFRVFKLARACGIKVMLDGQGADEIFAGYLSLTSARISSLLRGGHLRQAAQLMRALPTNTRKLLPRVMLAALGRVLSPRLRPLARRLAGEPAVPRWMNGGYFAHRGIRTIAPAYARGKELLKGEMLAGVERTSLPQLLRYEDINSMHFSIESRVPFCHVPLARLALSLPEDYLITARGSTKHVFREAVAGVVPEAIRTREKVGFQTPEASWLKGMRPYLQQVADSGTFGRLPFLNHKEAAQLLLGGQGDNLAFNPYSWRVLNVALWAERHAIDFGGTSP